MSKFLELVVERSANHPAIVSGRVAGHSQLLTRAAATRRVRRQETGAEAARCRSCGLWFVIVERDLIHSACTRDDPARGLQLGADE